MASATMPRTFQSSELSRNARMVFIAAEERPVAVTRRDGEDLVLMTRREADSREQLLEMAAQLIAASTDDRGTLGSRLANTYPWMLALSTGEQEKCAADLISAARASFSTGQAHLAAAELIAWKETAVALAAGLGNSPVEWLDDAPPVERPGL